MKFSIVFNNSGDSIPFNSVNPSALEYYVDCLDNNNLNSFTSDNRDSGSDIQRSISTLKTLIIDINKWMTIIADHSFPVLADNEYLRQPMLNQIHAEWVNIQCTNYDIKQKQKQYPRNTMVENIHHIFPDSDQLPLLATVIDHLGLSPDFEKINHLVHELEYWHNRLKFKINSHSRVYFNNPFDKSIITNNVANLRIEYDNLGRTLYNKYQTSDTDLHYDDENTFNEFPGLVSLNFNPPQTIPLSKEYTEWCNIHGKVPSGQFLNIGNLLNRETYEHDYMLIIFRNLLQNNSFSINLIEKQ